MKGKIIDLSLTLGGELQVTLALPRRQQEALRKLMGEDVSVEIKKWRERRSLSANAYAWVLIGKIAESVTPPLSKEVVYQEMLKSYGQGGMVSIRKDRLERVIRAFDYWEERGESEAGGREFVHLRVWVGSSKYDTLEMAKFIDGIVQEAKDLGIETLTPDELRRLKIA